ncbi:MAG: hypothetical protein ACOC8K_03640, partial [Gemmatimonadota bacterium]
MTGDAIRGDSRTSDANSGGTTGGVPPVALAVDAVLSELNEAQASLLLDRRPGNEGELRGQVAGILDDVRSRIPAT